MVAFAFLGNTLFLTILVSMLSNTFSNISANAVAEMQFRRAVLTLEGVKADAVFAYQPPFNILAVFLFLPLKFVVSPRWFHKIHVATVKFINLPLLLIIAVAERRLLWPHRKISRSSTKSFWQKWTLSPHQGLRAVFDLPPPDDVVEDIAVDDDMTRHLIRRQFTRQTTNEWTRQPSHTASHTGSHTPSHTPSRRDSMFPGIRKKLRGSFAEADEYEGVSGRLDDMEKTMSRMEVMISRLMPSAAVSEDERDEGMGGSSTLRGDGFTVESSFRGQTQTSDE